MLITWPAAAFRSAFDLGVEAQLRKPSSISLITASPATIKCLCVSPGLCDPSHPRLPVGLRKLRVCLVDSGSLRLVRGALPRLTELSLYASQDVLNALTTVSPSTCALKRITFDRCDRWITERVVQVQRTLSSCVFTRLYIALQWLSKLDHLEQLNLGKVDAALLHTSHWSQLCDLRVLHTIKPTHFKLKVHLEALCQATSLKSVEFEDDVLCAYKFAAPSADVAVDTRILGQLRALPLTRVVLMNPDDPCASVPIRWLETLMDWRSPVRDLEVRYANHLTFQFAQQLWRSLPHLERLLLIEPDDALLAALPELSQPVQLIDFAVTGRLASSEELKNAIGGQAKVHQEFVEGVSRMTSLQSLSWDCTGADAGLRRLPASLTDLQCFLAQDVTIEGLEALSALPRLRLLKLYTWEDRHLVLRRFRALIKILEEDARAFPVLQTLELETDCESVPSRLCDPLTALLNKRGARFTLLLL